MRTSAEFADMSDPTINRHFRRRWSETSPNESRRPVCETGTAAGTYQKRQNADTTALDRLSIAIETDWRRGRAAA